MRTLRPLAKITDLRAELDAYGQATRVGEGDRFGGEAYDWELPTRLHSSVWTADRSIEFLEKQNKSRPFFLAVGFQDPHHPHAVPTDFDDRMSADSVALPRYTEGELDDKPPHFRVARNGTIKDSRFRENTRWRVREMASTTP